MNEITTKPILKRRLSAEELVLSIRQGLEARDARFQNPPAKPKTVTIETEDNTKALAPLTNLHEVTARAKPGLTKLPIQFLRKVLRALLRPWTEYQTQFNQTTAQLLGEQNRDFHDKLTAVHERIEEENEATRKTNEAIRKSLEEVRYMWFDLNRRMEKLEAQTAVAASH